MYLTTISISYTIMYTRVYSKEEKRVSNVLYAPCKVFSESHMPGIQTLANESA